MGKVSLHDDIFLLAPYLLRCCSVSGTNSVVCFLLVKIQVVGSGWGTAVQYQISDNGQQQ